MSEQMGRGLSPSSMKPRAGDAGTPFPFSATPLLFHILDVPGISAACNMAAALGVHVVDTLTRHALYDLAITDAAHGYWSHAWPNRARARNLLQRFTPLAIDAADIEEGRSGASSNTR